MKKNRKEAAEYRMALDNWRREKRNQHLNQKRKVHEEIN